MKFLHIADVHMGCTRYQLPESPRDFFDAWMDVLVRFGVEERVDFVVMAGDFFHKRVVPPETMNYAVEGLTMMRDAGIPVVAIEGNHDQKYNDSEFSWLRSLSTWGLLKLLEPVPENGAIRYLPWDDDTKRGGYVDIGRARIFGSAWYGASGSWAIPALVDAVKASRREGGFHILLLHTDVEGHQVHPLPALPLDSLRELKKAVEYVGLGHTHKHYEIDNWAFNPGSIEITNISEFRETRGAFIVEVDAANGVTARHVADYRHRPFQQFEVNVEEHSTAVEVTSGVIAAVRASNCVADPGSPSPIVEIALRGRLSFPNSLLEVQKIRDQVRTMTGALHVRLKNHTVPTEVVESSVPEDSAREEVERKVIGDLITRDNRFKARRSEVTEAVIGAKRLALSDEEPAKIAEFISVMTGSARLRE